MMFSRFGFSHFPVMIFFSLASAYAGNVHVESPDAGSTKPTAQKVYKHNPPDYTLNVIQGTLSCPTCVGGSDEEDMYLLRVVSNGMGTVAQFSASTRQEDCFTPTLCGFADFDSQLWLFQLSDPMDCEPNGPSFARGLLASDDSMGMVAGRSRLVAQSNDGSMAMLVEPGCYLLAISAKGIGQNMQQFNNHPISCLPPPPGEICDIFTIENSTEVSGPDGPGGGNPHVGWSGGGPDAQVSNYRIILNSTAGFPAPPIPAVSGYGAIALSFGMVAAAYVLVRRFSSKQAT
jgi:hypothetical protein